MGNLAKGTKQILSNNKIGLMTMLNAGFTVAGGVADYKQSRLEGRGKITSAVTGVTNAVMYDALGISGMLTLGAIKYAPQLAVGGAMKMGQMARSMDRSARNVPFANSTFADSKQAFTMRQAGMQLAQASKYNLQQSLLGNEAASLHRL